MHKTFYVNTTNGSMPRKSKNIKKSSPKKSLKELRSAEIYLLLLLLLLLLMMMMMVLMFLLLFYPRNLPFKVWSKYGRQKMKCCFCYCCCCCWWCSCCCCYCCCLSQKPSFKVWLKSCQEQLRYWWHWVCGGGGWWCKVIFMSNPT